MREIRTLRAMWRALETGPRQVLNGHEGGNPGYKPRMSLRANRASARPYQLRWRLSPCSLSVFHADVCSSGH